MFRALPILIILLTVLIGAKLLEVLRILPDFMTAKPIIAAEEGKTEEKVEEKHESQNVSTDADKEAKAQKEQKKETVEGTKEEKKPAANFYTEPPKDIVSGLQFTPAELMVLKDLAARRQILDERERNIETRESSLGVLEKSINDKVENLRQMQDQMKSIVASYTAKEDEKIKSLVKVYEAMKPQDAAKIFEQLNMQILIEVSVKMKEVKLAQILAKMDPSKAKELTIELANRRKVKEVE